MTSRYESYGATNDAIDARSVLVVHGWNDHVRNSILDLLNSLGLRPIEWDQVVGILGEGLLYPGAVVDYALEYLQAVVVLLSPEEFINSDNDTMDGEPGDLPITGLVERPNVLFEAGMALAKDTRRTVLVEIGAHHTLNYLGEDYLIRLDNSREKRNALVDRLQRAGCRCDVSGSHWKRAGDFNATTASSSSGTSTTPTPPLALTGQSIRTKDTVEEEGISFAVQPAKEGDRGRFAAWGRITNSTPTKKYVGVSATYFSEDGSIVGTASGYANDIPPGGTKTVEIKTRDDVRSYVFFEAQIDNVFDTD